MSNKCGRIDIIMGCMFSGKSTEIIRRVNRYKALKKNILIINHISDTRYKTDSIVTHNKVSIDCTSLKSLSAVTQMDNYQSLDVIVIEEAQFFEDLYSFVLNAADNDNKIIIIGGLDGDSNRNEFGDIIKLIPKCDSVKKLHALCSICQNGTLACFTKRLVDDKEQILIGVNEFIPVCRYHYLKN